MTQVSQRMTHLSRVMTQACYTMTQVNLSSAHLSRITTQVSHELTQVRDLPKNYGGSTKPVAKNNLRAEGKVVLSNGSDVLCKKVERWLRQAILETK